MRGKRIRYSNMDARNGNIPAYAGKTKTPWSLLTLTWEHPRVCGENVWPEAKNMLNKGTSPRMRGKPTGLTGSINRTRNIPAYAGKTIAAPVPERLDMEHPRVCGENQH